MNDEIISVDFIESSGNVFADLALDDAEELLTRAKLGYTVRKMLESRHLKQEEIAYLLNIKQPEVSNLMTGKYHLFSETRLFHFLNKLEQKVIIHITSHHLGQPLIDVVIEP
jgi:predicted XRE-type DNA-binding protein